MSGDSGGTVKRERHWSDKRKPKDSPYAKWVEQAPAQAWADGWNAAVEECTRQMDAALAAERPQLGRDQ